MEIKSVNAGVYDLSGTNSNIGKLPVIIKDKILFAPGIMNEVFYAPEEVKRAFDNTDWTDKENISLIADHASTPLSVDNANAGLSVHDWFGFVKNTRLDEDGSISGVPMSIVGDLELHDENIAHKLVNAKARFGISPRVLGEDFGDRMENFTFKHFAVVTAPAMGAKAFINLSQDPTKKLEKTSDTEESNLPEKGNTSLKGGLEQMQEQENKEEVKTEEKSEEKDEKKAEDLSVKVDKLTEQLSKLATIVEKTVTKDMEEAAEEKEDVKEEAEKPEEAKEEPAEEKKEEVAEKPAEESEAVKDMAKKLEETTARLKEMEKQMNAPEKAAIPKDLSANANPMVNGYSTGDNQMSKFLLDNYA